MTCFVKFAFYRELNSFAISFQGCSCVDLVFRSHSFGLTCSLFLCFWNIVGESGRHVLALFLASEMCY